MEKLINYLLQFGQLNKIQIGFVQSHVTKIILKKEQFFSEAGKISNKVAFIEEGVLRVNYFNSGGEELTKYFLDENNFAVDINSYNNKIPSSEYIQAVTDCKLLVLTVKGMEELSRTIIGWDEIISKITAKALIEKVNRISPMMSEDGKARYLSFLEKFPGMANRIPLSMLASYLGITQSSLSRIRRGI